MAINLDLNFTIRRTAMERTNIEMSHAFKFWLFEKSEHRVRWYAISTKCDKKFCACPIKHSSKSISGNTIKNAVYKRRNKKVAKTRKTKKNAINSMGTPKFMIIKRNYKFNSIFNFRMILMAGATYRFIIGHFPITTIL